MENTVYSWITERKADKQIINPMSVILLHNYIIMETLLLFSPFFSCNIIDLVLNNTSYWLGTNITNWKISNHKKMLKHKLIYHFFIGTAASLEMSLWALIRLLEGFSILSKDWNLYNSAQLIEIFTWHLPLIHLFPTACEPWQQKNRDPCLTTNCNFVKDVVYTLWSKKK